MIKRLNDKGDTIVEVLIAIAVVASVMAIAYATMNRNLQTMRTNQERTEAVERARDQVEALRVYASTAAGAASLQAQTAGFCISSGGVLTPLNDGAPHASSVDDGDFSGYVPACIYDDLYHVGVRRENDSLGLVNYKVFIRWDKLLNSVEKNEVVIVYRID